MQLDVELVPNLFNVHEYRYVQYRHPGIGIVGSNTENTIQCRSPTCSPRNPSQCCLGRRESCELGNTLSRLDAEVFIADDDEKIRALRVVLDLRILWATSLLTNFITMALRDPPPAPLFSVVRSVVSR
jgi:hypothetical protein